MRRSTFVAAAILLIWSCGEPADAAPAPARASLVIDFGPNGLWTVIDGTFRQLHTVDPRWIAAGDLDGNGVDEVAVDFGPSHNGWIFFNNSYWLNQWAGGPGRVVNVAIANLNEVGVGERIWSLQDSVGRNLGWYAKSWDETSFMGYTNNGSFGPDNRDIFAFGQLDGTGGIEPILGNTAFSENTAGIVAYMNYTNAAILIHALPAQCLATGDFDGNGLDDVAIGFMGGGGTWVYRYGLSWIPIHPFLSAERLASGQLDGDNRKDLVIDFGPGYGIWIYNNFTSWEFLHPSAARNIVLADLDGNGIDEVIVDFGPDSGIWLFQNHLSWYQLSTWSADQIVVAHLN